MKSIREKAELTIIGCSFGVLNCYAVQHGHTFFGIGFGITAAVFLVRALRVK